MPETDLFLLFVERFNQLGLPYFVTGSIAGVIYGEPRVTHDVDLVLAARPGKNSKQIAETFPLDSFYCPPQEVLDEEARRRQRGHYNLIHHLSGFKADVYLAGKDPLHAWAMEERNIVPFSQTHVPVAPLEYVILRKLEFFREGGSEKHMRDVRAMLTTSGEMLRRREMERWLGVLGLASEWAHAQKD